MRDYGKVYSRIWESADFRALSEDGRALVLYLLTCQHGTISGAFRVPDGYATEDLQWSAERVSEGFAELLRKGFANRCETSKWVWVVKFLEWNPPENPNQRKAAVKVALSIPAGCAWKLDFMRVCGPLLGIEAPPEVDPSGTVAEGLPNQYQEQKQYQEQEQEQNTSGGGGAGAPPEGGPGTAADRRKSAAWKSAKSFLHDKGMAKDQTGTYLGALHRDYKPLGDETFLTVLEDLVKVRPAVPEEWLKAAFQRAAGTRQAPNRQEALEASNDAAVQRLLAKETTHAGS